MALQKLGTAWLAALLGCFIAAAAGAQTVYQSVDEQGNPAYADRPPLTAGEETPVSIAAIRYRRTDTAKISEGNAESERRARAEAVADGIRDEQAAEDAARAAQLAADSERKCEQAKARLQSYREARQLYRDLGNGEREYLTDAQLDAERVNAALAVDEWCGG